MNINLNVVTMSDLFQLIRVYENLIEKIDDIVDQNFSSLNLGMSAEIPWFSGGDLILEFLEKSQYIADDNNQFIIKAKYDLDLPINDVLGLISEDARKEAERQKKEIEIIESTAKEDRRQMYLKLKEEFGD